MKKIALFLILIFISCEEVIELELPNENPRFVIDASILWEKGTLGNEQQIRISKSAPYYQENVDMVSNASVVIQDESNNTFVFIEDTDDLGNYINLNFIPKFNENYTLIINIDGVEYRSENQFVKTSEIDFIEQELGGFGGEDIILKVFYTDEEAEENSYYFHFYEPNKHYMNQEVSNDEFTNGQQFGNPYFNEEIEVGDEIEITLAGITTNYYNYLRILLEQSGEESGGPFEAQPAQIRGNVINQENQNEFVFGYFNLSEYVKTTYTVE